MVSCRISSWSCRAAGSLTLGIASAMMWAQSGPVQLNVESGKGLTLTVNGVPIIQGSGFQFYAPGWTKGYYGSTSAWQNITKTADGQYGFAFKSADGAASGTESFKLNGNTLSVTAHFRWQDPRPCQIEFTAGQIWGDAVLASPYDANGQTGLKFGPAPSAKVGQGDRIITNMVQPLTLRGGWGSATISVPNSNGNWTVFDARNWPQDWTGGKSYLWFGAGGITIDSSNDITLTYSVQVTPAQLDADSEKVVTLTGTDDPKASGLPDETLPLVPWPKSHDFSSGEGLELTGAWSLPVGHFLFVDDFFKSLKNRYTFPKPTASTAQVELDGGLGDLHLPAEAFTIKITKSGVSVLGQDDNGLRYGLRRLALLAYSKGGKVYLPVGTLTDWPTVKWRGFHLFAGPDSIPFQSKLFDRVLGPLGFNNAVIQCERTKWDALPNLKGSDVMTKPTLAKLFEMYRSNGVDPIPLIESFGHDEWIFENGANLDLAVNPNQPWALDPRKAGTAPLLRNLWKEAIDLLHPDTIHFGCDEIDMESFPEGKDLLTEIWPSQMKTLADIAQSNKVKMMIWGDDLLAKGQAPDACNAPSTDVALERLKSIPAGTIIADWHYAGNPDYNAFTPSLSYWQSKGMVPVASTWYTPSNIASFDAAAAQVGAGTLQTTWCGYVSADENVVNAFNQFAAFVLAAEYSWTGRQDPPDKLSYNYQELFWKLYFRSPFSLFSTAGTLYGDKGDGQFWVGRYRFNAMPPLTLGSGLDPVGAVGPTKFFLKFASAPAGTQVALACYATHAMPSGTDAGVVTVQLEDGTTVVRSLRCGLDVDQKGSGNVAPLSVNGSGLYGVILDLPAGSRVKAIEINGTGTAAGLTICGLTVVK